ncbi:ABC transporter ATP-binding protein [Rhizobium lusitanum]|uniref:ABC transporter ATP-binding protein n=1 Tax=Rhizobium lusitanum TaxID=293958 RepID=UPI001573E120|nr:sn-glycerol-3-phosphate ABC transporter ATP-binding protein UgpC [Rhizobium lusitanum]NTJ11544.1 sn-glycerol-3-phosphate ABC transporter ATP-binding protein UgpC [Rhizobium lusitanum]
MTTLEIRNIRKRYGALEILKGIDLTLTDGEFLVLLGPSGCGKSTLLNMIAGLDSISDGEIVIGGQVINHVHPKDRNIAMVFQSYALYPNMTVAQNMAFSLKMRGVAPDEQKKAIEKVADLLQIGHLLDRKPARLSGGQRQRVAMGRALVRNPSIFLFDEPLSNLDAKLRIEMRTEIKKLHDRLGTTIVYVTHDQIEAMTLATRIAVMKEGVVQQFADPQTVYERPANKFVADFIGSPPMNFIPAMITKDHNGFALELADDEDAIRLPLPGHVSFPSGLVGKKVILGIRPESITKIGSNAAPRLDEAIIDGRVDVIEPTGAETLVVFKFGGVDVTARAHPKDDVRKGAVTKFMVDMSAISLFDSQTGIRLQAI